MATKLNLSAIKTQEGAGAQGLRVVVSDISASKQAQAAILESEAARAADQAKSEFLANMSHEIRTPMNGVIGMIDILQQTGLQPEQRRMLGVIAQSSQALLQILNDILDYSKIEAGKLAVEYIPTHLCEVVESVSELVSVTAKARSINLNVAVAPELPQWIHSDPTRLRQVLLNLIGNALKFTRFTTVETCEVSLQVTPCTR